MSKFPTFVIKWYPLAVIMAASGEICFLNSSHVLYSELKFAVLQFDSKPHARAHDMASFTCVLLINVLLVFRARFS